jgi:hypothetical protein
MKKLSETFFKDKANLALLCLGLLKLLIHLLTSQQYGYFRDELYYIAASKHLDFGYVDFPPFIALLTALIRGTLGESLLALHFFPALSGAVLVILTGLMARQLGARPFGQALAALTVLIAPQFLGADSRLTMDPFDTLFWGFAIYILILIFKYDRPKLWLWFGLAAGIGLTNKVTFLYFGLATVIGLALTPCRKYFRSPWLYLGGAIALAFLLPYLIWNAIHGWPTIDFWAAYGQKVYQASPLEFIFQQIMIMHPFTLPLWIMGLIYFFSKKGEAYRPLGWFYVTLLIVFMLQSSKNYFLAPMYPVLFAAGAIQFENLTQASRYAWFKPAYVGLLVVGGIIVAPMAISVLPMDAHVAYMRIMSGTNVKSEKFDTGLFPQHFADRFGWQEMAALVADIYHGLPPEDQARACIFAGNYGEAAALEFYSAQYGLPPILSGHNSYFIWGPGKCTGEVAIIVGAASLEDLKQIFLDVQQVSQTHCDYCMRFEDNLPIYVAYKIKAPFEQFWPSVKFFQ